MSDDLVKRLRSPANVFYEYAADDGAFLREAANRIEQLEAVLRDVLLWSNHCAACDYDDDWEKIETHARAALGEKNNE